MNKKKVGIYIFYIVLTTFFYIITIDFSKTISQTKLFYQDPLIPYEITAQLPQDGNKNIFISRAMHNKILASINSYQTSLFRSIDPVFLFSLSKESSLYDNDGPVQVMYPIELPVFLFAFWYIVRNWERLKKRYRYFPHIVVFSILLTGLFLPRLNGLKIIPLVIIIRTMYFMVVLDILERKKWL